MLLTLFLQETPQMHSVQVAGGVYAVSSQKPVQTVASVVWRERQCSAMLAAPFCLYKIFESNVFRDIFPERVLCRKPGGRRAVHPIVVVGVV